MLWTLFMILLVLWLLGLVTTYTLGGFIHLLLVIAVVVLVVRLMQGRPRRCRSEAYAISMETGAVSLQERWPLPVSTKHSRKPCTTLHA